MKRIQQLAILLFGFFLIAACTQSGNDSASTKKDYESMPASTEFDVVILNGRVMDPETNFDAVRNVGIKDGIIGLITEAEISGKETIDAKGLVVAPGFIDTHFHSVDPFATKLVVAYGVTTGMDLEAGSAPVGEWYAQKDSSGWQVNYGTTSAMISNRIFVHDPEVEITAPMDAALGSAYLDKAALDGTPGWSVT